jgi:hypothetical protein
MIVSARITFLRQPPKVASLGAAGASFFAFSAMIANSYLNQSRYTSTYDNTGGNGASRKQSMKNRAQNVWTWTIEELTLILLRQFKRLIAERGADWSDADLKALAARAEKRAVSEGDAAVVAALREIVAESEALLAQWGLTFEQSIATGMEDMPGWDTTADFLSLANDKINAELRISAGSALLALLGDVHFAPYALASVRHGIRDPEDVDAVITLRALAFAAQIDESAPDRLARIGQWVAARE